MVWGFKIVSFCIIMYTKYTLFVKRIIYIGGLWNWLQLEYQMK